MSMRSARRLPASLLALLMAAALAVPAQAYASLILALDLPALVARAERIAVVDVVSVHSTWNAGHDRIITAIDLAIVEPWKGELAAGRHVTVLQPGGTVGDVTTTVDGMPRFAPGERALVFLRGPAERATVVGLTQGKRPVHRDGASGRWMVRAPDRAGADFVRPRGASATQPIFDPRERPLDDVRAQVQSLAAAR